jgi:glycosyltransferase involved in cell wall biosynthesis
MGLTVVMHEQKIAILINSMTNGGAEKVACNLAAEMVRVGLDVEFFLLEKDDFYTPPDNIKVTYLSNQTEKESGLVKFLSLFAFSAKLKRLTAARGITVVQSHMYRSNFVNTLAKIFGSKHKSQIVNHGLVSRNLDRGIYGFVVLWLAKLLYKRADQCVLVSNQMQSDLAKYVDISNTVVINNPFDINEIQSFSSMTISPAEFIFKPDKKYLICAGRFIKIKRFDVIIESLTHLDEEIDLIVLGDGDQREYLVSLTKKMGLTDRVHFIGNVQNPFKYFKNCDIFVLSSETEGFPMVLIEAMACDLAIIASDCKSGPREILDAEGGSLMSNCLEKTDYGILTKIGDPKCLAEAVSMMISDKKLMVTYTRNSRERMWRYSTEKIVNKYISNMRKMT